MYSWIFLGAEFLCLHRQAIVGNIEIGAGVFYEGKKFKASRTKFWVRSFFEKLWKNRCRQCGASIEFPAPVIPSEGILHGDWLGTFIQCAMNKELIGSVCLLGPSCQLPN